MTAFLIDEMFSARVASVLRDKYGLDAVHVVEAGLRGAPDSQVAATARAQDRAVVTDNVADISAERDLILLFALKRHLPEGGGQAAALAALLDRWNVENPDPYIGAHWPRVD